MICTSPGRSLRELREGPNCAGRTPNAHGDVKKTVRVVALVSLASLCPWALLYAQASLENLVEVPAKLGVRVEQIEQGGDAHAAGIQVGDRINEWSLRGNSGTIESSFDWAEMLAEEAPRGTITLRGWRGDQKMVWSLGLRTLGLTVGPLFPERLTKAYESCRALRSAEKHKEASLCWESLGGMIRSDDPQ